MYRVIYVSAMAMNDNIWITKLRYPFLAAKVADICIRKDINQTQRMIRASHAELTVDVRCYNIVQHAGIIAAFQNKKRSCSGSPGEEAISYLWTA